MANLTREDVARYKDPEMEAGIAGLPPGYIEGFRPKLQSNLTVYIGGGITSVQGRRVEREGYVLRRSDWNDPYTGGSQGFFYYVYLTREGEYKVSFVKPEFSDAEYYYAHPAYDWRVILKLWIDSDDKIRYVTKDYTDSPRNVTVAAKTYVGDADYYCDGVNDEIWIEAAIIYADRVQLLSGTYYMALPVTITKDNWILSGQGANAQISITASSAPIVLSSADNVTLQSVKTKGDTAASDLFTATSCNSLVVDACTFEMNTGFTMTSCHFASIRNSYFKGIEDYIGGSLAFTTCSSINISGNNFRYYGTTQQFKTASMVLTGCSGSILNNTFFQSGSILLDSSTDVALTVSGNDHQDPVLFWDEGDASFGPGVAYGSNTETA